jgi:hypothetical protein
MADPTLRLRRERLRERARPWEPLRQGGRDRPAPAAKNTTLLGRVPECCGLGVNVPVPVPVPDGP